MEMVPLSKTAPFWRCPSDGRLLGAMRTAGGISVRDAFVDVFVQQEICRRSKIELWKGAGPGCV